MTGIDTNVLVRYLTQDHAAQARRANSLLMDLAGRREPCHLSSIVLCELVWVLRGAYRHGKTEVVAVLEKILDTAQFSIEDKDLVRSALDDFRSGAGDFADYLLGHRNKSVGCTKTSTFDRNLTRSELFDVM